MCNDVDSHGTLTLSLQEVIDFIFKNEIGFMVTWITLVR